MNTEHRQQKISFWHSMKTQFIAVVILVAAVIVILYTLMIMPGVKSNIRSIYSNYLLDLSISYGREVESAMHDESLPFQYAQPFSFESASLKSGICSLSSVVNPVEVMTTLPEELITRTSISSFLSKFST